MPKSIRLAALLAAAALAGCGSSPDAKFYTLSSIAAPQQAVATAPYMVAIGAVTVPDVVDRPQIVTRSGANEVMINEFALWAEPLKSVIPRAIAENLNRELDGALVSTYPQSTSISANCRVQIQVQRFDSALGDAATVELLWTVAPPKGASKSGRSVVHEATGGAGYDALAAAHRRALTAVSREIAAAVRAAMAQDASARKAQGDTADL